MLQLVDGEVRGDGAAEPLGLEEGGGGFCGWGGGGGDPGGGDVFGEGVRLVSLRFESDICTLIWW